MIRTFLTVLGIATATALLFSVLSFYKGFQQRLHEDIARTGLHFMVVPSGCAHEVASLVLHGAVIPKSLDSSVLGQILDTQGIEFATEILVAQLPNQHTQKIDLLYGMDMSLVDKIKPQWSIVGAIPTKANEVLLGYEIAEHYNLKPSDTLQYPDIKKDFKVAGIVSKTNTQDDAFVYMPIETAQEILNMPKKATAIGVRVKKPEELSKITDELSSKIAGIQIVTMNQVLSAISNLIASAKALSLAFVIVATAISAVGLMNALITSVFERTAELAMMRAIGATRFQIFQLVLIETFTMTMLGSILGIGFAVLAKDLIESFIKKTIPYIPAGRLAEFDLMTILICVSFSVLVGGVSGLLPAIRATKIEPIEAIKA